MDVRRWLRTSRRFLSCYQSLFGTSPTLQASWISCRCPSRAFTQAERASTSAFNFQHLIIATSSWAPSKLSRCLYSMRHSNSDIWLWAKTLQVPAPHQCISTLSHESCYPRSSVRSKLAVNLNGDYFQVWPHTEFVGSGSRCCVFWCAWRT